MRVVEIVDDENPVAALARYLATLPSPASEAASQVALGSAQLMLLPIAREGRGGPEVAALLDLVLSRWPDFADREGFHAQEFLRNAFAGVGDDPDRIAQLLAIVPPSASAELRHAIAAALAIVGDKAAMLDWLDSALAAGVTTAQIKRDSDFAAFRDDPDVRVLLRDVIAPAIPVRIEPYLPAVRFALDDLIGALKKLGQPTLKNPPATLDAVIAAETARRIQLPNDYRAMLTLTDGLAIWDNTFFATADYASDTALAREARDYLEMSARYGATGVDACIPIANWGRPHDWLLYDPFGRVRRGVPGYVLITHAEETPVANLISALEQIEQIATDVLATN